MAEHKFDVRTSPSLGDDTPIHRIVDFFSVAHLLTSNILYIPLGERLKDPNEGIDSALDLYAVSAGPCAGITRFFSNNEEFKKHHQRQKQLNYVSCWSQLRESVAMWALYSPDSSSVQITTTIGRLKDALLSYCKREHDPQAAIEDADKNGQFIQSARIVPVKYLSLLDLGKRINRRRRAYDKLDSNGLIRRSGKVEDWSHRDLARADQYQFAPFELKDASFSHEIEIRAIIEAVPYDVENLKIARSELHKNIDYGKLTEPNYDRGMLRYAHAILREEGAKKQLAPVGALFLPVPQGFITQVSIDPRCPPHKYEHMRSFFSERGIPIISSTCFGYAANVLGVQPRSKLLRDTEPELRR